MFYHATLAQTTAPAPAPGAPPQKPPDSGMSMMVTMLFAFAIMYFLMIRPQSKKQKQLAAQIAALKTGDRVVTSGGIHGVVANVKDGSSLLLKIADNVKIEVEKSAVGSVIKPDTEAKA